MTSIPSQSEHYEGGKAHGLGFIDGTNAATSGVPRNSLRDPQRRGTAARWSRKFTNREWDEYRRGWDEALDAYDTDNA